jgi:hypothetical protein
MVYEHRGWTMVTGTLRRTADGYVIDVAREDVERSGLQPGQTVIVTAPGETAGVESAPEDEAAERQAWRQHALRSLEREWDNEADAVYDQLP